MSDCVSTTKRFRVVLVDFCFWWLMLIVCQNFVRCCGECYVPGTFGVVYGWLMHS